MTHFAVALYNIALIAKLAFKFRSSLQSIPSFHSPSRRGVKGKYNLEVSGCSQDIHKPCTSNIEVYHLKKHRGRLYSGQGSKNTHFVFCCFLSHSLTAKLNLHALCFAPCQTLQQAIKRVGRQKFEKFG